jgi:hypothetical protein
VKITILRLTFMLLFHDPFRIFQLLLLLFRHVIPVNLTRAKPANSLSTILMPASTPVRLVPFPLRAPLRQTLFFAHGVLCFRFSLFSFNCVLFNNKFHHKSVFKHRFCNKLSTPAPQRKCWRARKFPPPAK